MLRRSFQGANKFTSHRGYRKLCLLNPRLSSAALPALGLYLDLLLHMSLKINSNIKAGQLVANHNEKLTSDNNHSIEQKETVKKKLRLSKETIRELKDGI